MNKTLVAFDFDHTILDDNSDTVLVALIGKSNIPQQVKELHHRDGWTSFMQGVFRLLVERGVNEEVIKDQIENLPAVQGMLNLIAELKKMPNYDTIIISDCNSYFIKVFLEKHNLSDAVLRVFTNPAEFVDGMLKISPYHHQTSCKLSTKNLCKGRVLDEFLEEQRNQGVLYDKVVYIGDGVNDFCPILHLNANDLICARNKFKLQELVLQAKAGKSLDNTGKLHNIKAEVMIWDNADEILQKIKN